MEYFWDFLRPLTDFAAAIDPYAKIFVLLLAFGIFVVSVLAYRKVKSNKFLFVSIAFFLFSVKWLFQVFDIFLSPGNFLGDSSQTIFELFILIFLFLAIFRK